GGIDGALGAAASSTMTPILAEHITALDIPFELKIALVEATGAAVGGLAGGSAGAAAGLNETVNNFAVLLRAAQFASQVAKLGLDKLSAAEAAVLQSCVSTAVCRQLVSSVLPAGAIAWLASQNTPTASSSLVDQIPGGYAAGDKPQPSGSLVTPIPDPKEMQKLYGTPPLENPDALRSWLTNALQGYPADEAEKWARDLIHTLPAAEQLHYSDFILAAVKGGMLGEQGVQVPSKTVWKGNGKERLDVENPNPGQRPGQIHYQDNNGNKYIYDPSTKSFPNAPNSVNKMLNNPDFRQAIEKGLVKYLGE
ncbi:MAG: hypothetical protein C0490_13610, partial [Marivirga sp.]|nr:hypothetical protein [Marivirga sp.]